MAAPFKPSPHQPDPESVTADATPTVEADAVTDSTPQPTGPAVRPRLTLQEILRSAADLIDEADDAGLTLPYGANAHDYGPSECTLYLHQSDTEDIWGALRGWATRYRSEIDTYPASTPGAVHAKAQFRRQGIRFEASAVITTDDQPPDASQAGQ